MMHIHKVGKRVTARNRIAPGGLPGRARNRCGEPPPKPKLYRPPTIRAVGRKILQSLGKARTVPMMSGPCVALWGLGARYLWPGLTIGYAVWVPPMLVRPLP